MLLHALLVFTLNTASQVQAVLAPQKASQINFDGDSITILSVPHSPQTNMRERIESLQKAVPVKDNAWRQLEDWPPALDNLRTEDVKLAQALAAELPVPLPVRENDQFALHFPNADAPQSCKDAYQMFQELMGESAKEAAAMVMKVPFKDPKPLLVSTISLTAQVMRCHRDLLLMAQDTEKAGVSLSMPQQNGNRGCGRYEGSIHPLVPTPITAPKTSTWRKVIPNIKMDDKGTQVNLLIMDGNACLADEYGRHNRIGELCLATPLALASSILIPVVITAGVIGAVSATTQGVYRMKHRFSSKDLPIFAAQEELAEIASMSCEFEAVV